MDILTVLKKLGELEQEAGGLYERFASLFTQDAKAQEFFEKLAADEKAHYDLVKYQERVVRKSPKDFGAVDADLKAVEKTIHAIKEFRKEAPAIRDAIRFALDLETEIAELYTASIMKQSNEEFAQLMKTMGGDQQTAHYKQLIAFAASYA